MTRINTNLVSLTAQANLIRSQSAQSQALTRLSTGLQINSGADNPSGLIAASTLGAEITSINASISNSQRATNIISTVDAALSQVGTLLNNVRGLVQSSANKGAISTSEIAANQVQLDSALNSITRIGQTTVFGGDTLLNGTKAYNVTGSVSSIFASTTDIQVNSFDPSAAQAGAGNDVTVALTQAATKKTVQLVGDSQNAGGASSLRNLSLGTSTRATSVVVTNSGVVAAGGAGLNNLTSDSTHATRTIAAGSLTGLTGTGNVRLTITGVDSSGNAATQTVNADAALASAGTGSGDVYLANLINTKTAQTGVYASASSGAVVLKSIYAGTTGNTINVQAGTTGTTAGSATYTVASTALTGTTGDNGKTLSFTITNGLGSDTVTLNLTGTAYTLSDIATAIGANNTNTGITAAVVGGNLVVTNKSTQPASDTITFGAAGGNTTSGNKSALDTAIGAATTSNNNVTTFNGNVGTITNGAFGAGAVSSSRSTVFTITGNKGSATVDTAALVNGSLTGNDVLINNQAANNTGLQKFVDLINTRTNSTGVTASIDGSGNLKLTSGGVGASSVATIDVAASGNDQNTIRSLNTRTVTAGVSGVSNQTTIQLTGDKGTASITVNNDQVINDSGVLRDAINRVSSQTGITAAATSGNLNDVVLSSANYGSGAKLTVNAISSTNAADITLLNSTSTQVSTAGKDIAGTVATSKGTGSFTGTGATINYQDSSISLIGNANAAAAQPTSATTTIAGNPGSAGGLTNLTGTGGDTITFQLSGVVGGTATSTNITVNVAALKADSRVLTDAINKTTLTSGVSAKLATGASNALGDIVLTSTTAGATGSVGITATAATQAADVTVFNNAATQTGTAAGLNAPAAASASFDVSGGALFQIGPSVNYQNQVTANITSLDLNTLGRNVLTTGTSALASLLTGGTNALSSTDLSNAASLVDQAINQISTLRGQLGALQANVLQSNITSQQATLEQVTSAQSNIQDTNFAAETANLTRAQILVQAGTSVLQIANSATQQVLSLLPRG